MACKHKQVQEKKRDGWIVSVRRQERTGNMQIGKLSEPALKRSVLRQLNRDQQNVPEYGADCSMSAGCLEDTVLSVVVNEVPGFEKDPAKLIIAAENNLSAAGAQAEAFLVSAVLPEDYEESSLKEDIRRLSAAARRCIRWQTGVRTADAEGREQIEAGAPIIGGHTQISDAVARPVYSVTAIGKASAEENRQAAVLQPGDDLVVTESIALGGTAALAAEYEERLRNRYPFSLIDQAKEFEQKMAVGETARAITHFGTAAVHDISQGGIFNALWEMADRAGVGLEVDLKKIPVRQETVEICEYFDVNPYYLYSAGALLVGTQHGEGLVSYLAARGIRAAVIGRVTDGNDRVIRSGEECRYLDRPKQDEWYRLQGTLKAERQG